MPLIGQRLVRALRTAPGVGVNRSTNGTPLRLGDLGHGGRVELESCVVLRVAVGQVRVLEVLVGDRREQHEPRAVPLPLYFCASVCLMNAVEVAP